MKKDLLVGFVILVLSFTSMIGIIHDTNYYGLTAEIIELDYESDTVTVMDANGFTWDFKGCEDYFKGDLVSLVMDDRGTDFIYDDKIVNDRYSGYWKEVD